MDMGGDMWGYLGGHPPPPWYEVPSGTTSIEPTWGRGGLGLRIGKLRENTLPPSKKKGMEGVGGGVAAPPPAPPKALPLHPLPASAACCSLSCNKGVCPTAATPVFPKHPGGA